jgi:hypothetical protein
MRIEPGLSVFLSVIREPPDVPEQFHRQAMAELPDDADGPASLMTRSSMILLASSICRERRSASGREANALRIQRSRYRDKRGSPLAPLEREPEVEAKNPGAIVAPGP